MRIGKATWLVVILVVLSVAFSLMAWWSFVTPRVVPMSLAKALNFPPAVVGTLLGRRTLGPNGFITASVGNCDFCSPRRVMFTYLSAAIPAYLTVFAPFVIAVARFRTKPAA